jgi:hypothetical protein
MGIQVKVKWHSGAKTCANTEFIPRDESATDVQFAYDDYLCQDSGLSLGTSIVKGHDQWARLIPKTGVSQTRMRAAINANLRKGNKLPFLVLAPIFSRALHRMLNHSLCAHPSRKGSSYDPGAPSDTPDEFLNVHRVEE